MTIHELVNDPNTLLVDVRTAGEFERGNVSGSVNIPLNEIPARVNELKTLSNDKAIAVFCLSGGRSGQADMFLKQSGFDNVTNVGTWSQVQIHRMASV